MRHETLFRPQAEAELEEAYRWYEQRRDGLGADFLLCVEEALEKISRDPEVYPIVHRGARRVLIRHSPYGIFYVMEEQRVVVLAVFHGRREPKQWRSRA